MGLPPWNGQWHMPLGSLNRFNSAETSLLPRRRPEGPHIVNKNVPSVLNTHHPVSEQQVIRKKL